MPRRRQVGSVGGVRREVEEQPLVGRRAVEELHRPLRQHVGGVVGRVGAVLAAVAEPVVVVGARPVRRTERGEAVPSRRGVALRRPVGEGVEVLADQAGAVAARRQRGREGAVLVAVLVEPPPATGRPGVGPHAGVVREPAGQQRRPRRAAQRGRHHRVAERGAAVDQQPLHLRHPGQGAGRLVVGQDHHHVRRVVVLPAGPGGGAPAAMRRPRRSRPRPTLVVWRPGRGSGPRPRRPRRAQRARPRSRPCASAFPRRWPRGAVNRSQITSAPRLDRAVA